MPFFLIVFLSLYLAHRKTIVNRVIRQHTASSLTLNLSNKMLCVTTLIIQYLKTLLRLEELDQMESVGTNGMDLSRHLVVLTLLCSFAERLGKEKDFPLDPGSPRHHAEVDPLNSPEKRFDRQEQNIAEKCA